MDISVEFRIFKKLESIVGKIPGLFQIVFKINNFVILSFPIHYRKLTYLEY